MQSMQPEDAGSSTITKKQIKFSLLRDVCVLHGDQSLLCQCVCCLRTIFREDAGTKLVTGGVQELQQAMLRAQDKKNSLYAMQLRLLQEKEVWSCFICEPVIRKCIIAAERNVFKNSPSKFVSDAINAVEYGVFQDVNHFSILKGCVVLSSVAITDESSTRHPMRGAHREMLECVVKMTHDIAARGEKFREMPEIVEMISHVRWKHRGFLYAPLSPVLSGYDNVCIELKYLRKSMRCEKYQSLYQRGKADSDLPCVCAGCYYAQHDVAAICKSPRSYKHSVLMSWDKILPFLTHKVDVKQQCSVPPYSLLCEKKNAIQLRSFAYYKELLSEGFPDEFVFEDEHMFYSYQLQQHLAQQGGM